MSELIYTPARETAPALHQRLLDLHEEARRDGRRELAPLVDADVIERFIEVGFWASLRREEGRSPKISLAALPRNGTAGEFVFDRPLPLTPQMLTRLSPAVERPGIHLCIRGGADDLRVWGATRSLPEFCLVLEVVEPGLLVAKYSRVGTYVKFGNLAVFRGDTVKLTNENAARRPDCPELLANLTGVDDSSASLMQSNVLVQLALSMRAHQHGGTLLIVPNDDSWKRSIISPINYRVTPPYSGLAEIARRTPEGEDDASRWRDDMRQAIEGVAGLTAVDGAALMDTQYRLLAFGAKIDRAVDSSTVKEVVLMEPVVGQVPTIVNVASLGGTRHLSAAQFAYDQHDALALVASQDDHFTIFAWSKLENRVHAHRIETLLL